MHTHEWRKLAVAALAEEGIVIPDEPRGRHKTTRALLTGEVAVVLDRGHIICYPNGKVSIGGPAPDASFLAGALARRGLLHGWRSGSRGKGVTWRAGELIPLAERPWDEEAPDAR